MLCTSFVLGSRSLLEARCCHTPLPSLHQEHSAGASRSNIVAVPMQVCAILWHAAVVRHVGWGWLHAQLDSNGGGRADRRLLG